jgi:threonine dehydratase
MTRDSQKGPSLQLSDILAARKRIAGGIYESPCVESIPLSKLTGAHIFCKLDYLSARKLQGTRRAQRAAASDDEAAQARASFAAVAGNHAQGVGLPRQLLGIPVHVGHAEIRGAHQGDQLPAARRRVILHGADLTEARAHAERSRAGGHLTFIIRSTTADVMAGQGTMGLEIRRADARTRRRRGPVGRRVARGRRNRS